MRVQPLEWLLAFLLLLAFLSAREPVDAQGGTANADPDFDAFYNSSDGTSGPWKPYKISNPGPSIWKAPVEGWPKGPSLWVYGDAIPFDGGVYQVVAATAGRGYHLEVAWAVVRHGGVAVYDDSLLARLVGIDPTGGTNPLAPGVQWSGEHRGSGKFAPELSIDQYARSDRITIFLRAKNSYPDQRAEVFFDHAALTENPGMPPISVAPPTPTPTPTIARPPTPAMARTRVALAPSATAARTMTATATRLPTDTPQPTVTRTPRATATPVETGAPPPELSRLAVSFLAVGCLGACLTILMASLVFLLSRPRV